MTRSQMLNMLRRQLQEDSADQWSDADLNTYLGMGLHSLQQAIMAIRPHAFLRVDDTDIVDASANYILARIQKPAGFHHEIRLQKKTATNAYTDLEMISYLDTRARTSGDLKYAHWGSYFLLSPAPSAAVTAGLRLEWVPTLSMGADTDVPDVPISLHKGIVYWAAKDALGETSEAAKMADVQLKMILEQMPGFFYESGASALSINYTGFGRG